MIEMMPGKPQKPHRTMLEVAGDASLDAQDEGSHSQRIIGNPLTHPAWFQPALGRQVVHVEHKAGFHGSASRTLPVS
jgi:hypothetical protein